MKKWIKNNYLYFGFGFFVSLLLCLLVWFEIKDYRVFIFMLPYGTLISGFIAWLLFTALEILDEREKVMQEIIVKHLKSKSDDD